MSAAGEYVVICAGVSYRRPGDGNGTWPAEGHAHQGRVIEVDAEEATRLLALDAIRPATDADRDMDKILAAREADSQRPPEAPPESPWGGRPLYPQDREAFGPRRPSEMLGVELMTTYGGAENIAKARAEEARGEREGSA